MEVLQEFHVRQVLSASMTHVTIVTLLLAELIVAEYVPPGTSQFTDIDFELILITVKFTSKVTNPCEFSPLELQLL